MRIHLKLLLWKFQVTALLPPSSSEALAKWRHLMFPFTTSGCHFFLFLLIHTSLPVAFSLLSVRSCPQIDALQPTSVLKRVHCTLIEVPVGKHITTSWSKQVFNASCKLPAGWSQTSKIPVFMVPIFFSSNSSSFLFNLAKEHHTPPTFIFKPQSKKVFEGDTARLECQISAIPTPRIYWKRNNEMVQYNTDRISLLHDNTGRICLLIHNANKKDAGWYTVSAVNGAGVATCHARLEVATHANKPVPAPKQLRVRPTFSKYLALNGRGLDVKQAFSPEGEFQRLAEQSGLYESDEL